MSGSRIDFQGWLDSEEELSLDELAARCHATQVVVTPTFKDEIWKALAAGQLELTPDRKLRLPKGSTSDG